MTELLDRALDRDLAARLNAYDRARDLHRDENCRHAHETVLAAILGDAELIYQFTVHGSEDPRRLIIYTGLPYEQGDPPPEGEGVVLVAITLTDTQQTDLTVQPVDSKGAPTDDPSLVWSVDDDTVASLVVDPSDPKHVTVVAGNPGVATVTVSDGTITGAEAFTVTAGATAALNIVPGAVTEQPAPAPTDGGGGAPAQPQV